MTDVMGNKILEIISNHSIFSFEDVKECYEVIGSYDKLIYAVEHAPKFGISLIDMCKHLEGS